MITHKFICFHKKKIKYQNIREILTFSKKIEKNSRVCGKEKVWRSLNCNNSFVRRDRITSTGSHNHILTLILPFCCRTTYTLLVSVLKPNKLAKSDYFISCNPDTLLLSNVIWALARLTLPVVLAYFHVEPLMHSQNMLKLKMRRSFGVTIVQCGQWPCLLKYFWNWAKYHRFQLN